MPFSTGYGYASREENGVELLPLASRFQICQKLETSQATLYFLAQDLQFNPPPLVLLKVHIAEIENNLSALLFFLLEAQSAAKLVHKNIAKCQKPEQHYDTHFYVSEYKEGAESLRDLIDHHGWFDVHQTMKIALQIAEALRYAHESGVLHLELEPKHILIDKEGKGILTGFGVPATREYEWAMRRRSNSCIPAYRSPEQVAESALDERSDLYMLGAVLYEMLTDLLPLYAEDEKELKRKILTQAPVPTHFFRPEIPESFSLVVTRLLAKEPVARYQNAASLCAELEQLLEEPVPEPLETGEKSAKESSLILEESDEPLAHLFNELEAEPAQEEQSDETEPSPLLRADFLQVTAPVPPEPVELQSSFVETTSTSDLEEKNSIGNLPVAARDGFNQRQLLRPMIIGGTAFIIGILALAYQEYKRNLLNSTAVAQSASMGSAPEVPETVSSSPLPTIIGLSAPSDTADKSAAWQPLISAPGANRNSTSSSEQMAANVPSSRLKSPSSRRTVSASAKSHRQVSWSSNLDSTAGRVGKRFTGPKRTYLSRKSPERSGARHSKFRRAGRRR